MFKFINFILFISTILLSNTYYYSNGERVVLKKKPSISRGLSIKKCYSHTDIDDNICLEDEIIIHSHKKHIAYLLKTYKLTLEKKLLKNLFLVKTKNHNKTLDLANTISQDARVKYAYPNFESTIKFRASTTPLNVSDPYGAYAWHLKNTGQGRNYKIGADIKIEEAWLNNKGLAIKIGMIDDGIEISHPDIVYLDGYSASNPAARNPEHHITNTAHHGTQAASLIAGRANQVGSVGVAPEAFLYVVNVDGSPKVSDLVSAFTWLKDKEVDVISNSWGSYKVPDPVVTVVKDIIQTGRKGKGTPVVFAVGDDKKNLDDAGVNDESEIEGVISVAASTPYDNRYVKSNFGSKLTLVAPGTNMIVAREDEDKKQFDFATNAVGTKKQLFITRTGTSLSAPIVAGGIALMIYANEDITASAITNILKHTSDKIATNEYSYDVEGRNNYYGYGRLNLADAVRAASVWSDKSAFTRENDLFVLNIEKGWNLLSIPVNEVVYQKDFKKYFGYGSKIITLNNGAYNHYVKVLFPKDGFYLNSLFATKVDFIGKEYTIAFDDVPTVEGWNLLGVGKDTNVTEIRGVIPNIDYVYFYRDNKLSINTEANASIKRGEGFFLYQL